MPTVPDTISIARLSLAMARTDVDKSAFRGPVLDYLLPWKILVVKTAVQWAYAQSATYENLDKTANFLYALCDKYGILASDALDIQTAVDGGPVVTIVDEVNIFPLYKTSADFASATVYEDDRLYGNSIRVFIDEINRNLFSDEYTVTPTGLTILLDGFDATVNDYHLEIKKVNT